MFSSRGQSQKVGESWSVETFVKEWGSREIYESNGRFAMAIPLVRVGGLIYRLRESEWEV